MKPGQTLHITSSSSKGRITAIDKSKNSIDIDWKKSDGSSRYNETIRYYLPYIENLLKQNTISLLDDLPVKNPNTLFNNFKE